MKKVIITGMGVLSPAGLNLEEFWNTLYSGKVTYGALDELKDNPGYRIKIGSKIKNDAWKKDLPDGYEKRYGKAACYSLCAVKSALRDSGLPHNLRSARVSVIIGTTMGEIETEEKITGLICQNRQVTRSMYQNYPTRRIVDAVAEWTGAGGFLLTVPAACAAGNYAVDLGKKLLEWNYADIVIAGGVDVFSYVAFAGFQRLLSLAPDKCSPFDKHRKGLVLGEGCGIVIMEREGDRADQKRYGSVLGSSVASDAYHMTAPDENGTGEYTVMKNAMKEAGIMPSDVDYISAHGTGTKRNDAVESKAIISLFGTETPKVSSMKSILGHSLGAASILEAIGGLLMMRNRIVLPNINYEAEDDECRLNIVSGNAVEGDINVMLSNSFAFGGQTSCLVLGI